MNKCPRCKNEKLREGQNFCQICGLSLKEISNEQVIECLKGLREQYKCIYGDEFIFEISCLEIAIKELERTAQEVPVQEQYVSKCSQCNKENKISLPQNIILKYCMSCGNKITYIKKDTFYPK